MRTFYLLFIMALFLYTNSVYSLSETFDFGTASTFGDPTKVTQTIGSITLTVSTTTAINDDLSLMDGGSYGGTSGNVVFAQWASATTMVLTFSTSVNIGSLRACEINGANYTWTFTPNTGSAQNIPVNGTNGTSANFGTNFLGITSITITRQGGGVFNPAIDNVVMDASLPVELTSFTASVSGGKVTLDWQTATEANNYGFEIERKAPLNLPQGETSRMGEWETIGFVQGNGNSNSTKEYSFIDNSPLNGTIQYRLKQIDADGSYSYSDVVEVSLNQQPAKFELQQNYPNPFNPTTTIKFSLPVESMVALEVYNIVGERVASLLSEELNAGYHEIEFDATSLSSGTYFYKLQAGEFVSIKKFILMK